MRKKNIISLHVIFWFVTLVSTGVEVIPMIGKRPVNFIIWDYLIYAFSYILIFYLFYFFISQKYLSKKYVKYLIIYGLLFTVLISLLTAYAYIYFLVKDVFALDGRKFFLEYSKYFLQFFETNFIFALSGSLLKTALLWYKSTLKQKEIEKQLVSSELALLKTQINPKFLIDTLADLKSRMQESPDTAIGVIENLSEIMSFMLYESQKDFIRLNDEIKFLRSYLYLYKVKSDTVDIKFEINGGEREQKIPPLLFFTFTDAVLNSGIISSGIEAIIVKLIDSDNKLQMEIEFLLKDDGVSISPDKNTFEEIIRRRLNLLFEKNYTLQIECEKNKYLFKLEIEGIYKASSLSLKETELFRN